MQLPAVDFADPFGDVVQEVAVVGDGQYCPGVGLEVSFEPVHGFGVEVVGRLVEEQQIGLLEQQFAQGDATPFSS